MIGGIRFTLELIGHNGATEPEELGVFPHYDRAVEFMEQHNIDQHASGEEISELTEFTSSDQTFYSGKIGNYRIVKRKL